MKFLALAVFAIAFVAVSAKPSLLHGWAAPGQWWGHGTVAVAPGAAVVGPAGSIVSGPVAGGAVIPGAWGLGHAGWLGHGWAGHGLGHWW